MDEWWCTLVCAVLETGQRCKTPSHAQILTCTFLLCATLHLFAVCCPGPDALTPEDKALAKAADAAAGANRTTHAPAGTFSNFFEDPAQGKKAASYMSAQRRSKRKAGEDARHDKAYVFPEGAEGVFHSVVKGRIRGSGVDRSGAVKEACELLQKLESCTPEQQVELGTGIEESGGRVYDAVWYQLDQLKEKLGLVPPRGQRRGPKRSRASAAAVSSSVVAAASLAVRQQLLPAAVRLLSRRPCCCMLSHWLQT